MSLYTAEERRDYTPPPCPDCGSNDQTEVEWEDVTTAADTHPRLWAPSRVRCRRCQPEGPA